MRTYTQKEINVVKNLLEHHDQVIDYMTNENTKWNVESLLDLVVIKTPTLEEVQEHFKNAKTIESCFGDIHEIGKIVHGHCLNTFMIMGCCATVWNEKIGYAKIITTK